MIENKSSNFFMLLDYFYFMVDFNDLIHIFNTIASLGKTAKHAEIK